MSNVKDLVDEHFTRALSNVANKQRHFPPLVEQQLCGPSLLNRGKKAITGLLTKHTEYSIKYTHTKSGTRNSRVLITVGVKKETSSSAPSTTSTPSPMSHTPTSLVLSPQTYLHPHRHGKAPIVYPEFVQFLVHPGVDSFRDIPRLPGQSQQITTTPKGWESHSAKGRHMLFAHMIL